MERVLLSVAIAAILVTSTVALAVPAAAKTKVVGWVEWALVTNKKLRMRAKLDTGALTTSIHAEDVEQFSRDGRDWVRFTIRTRKGEETRVEAPVHRWVRIRRAGAKVRKRAVVLLEICLAGQFKKTQVNLSSRERMNYALLIGRRFMGAGLAVDSSRKFTTEPECAR